VRKRAAVATGPELWAETPAGAEPLPGGLEGWLAAAEPRLISLRRYLHAHPELSGREFATSEFVAETLRQAGLEPRILPKGTGVICDVGSGERCVALRADLDALPLPDTKDVPYRSSVENVCHACGHDVHTSVLLGAGQALAQLDADGMLPGRVRLLFQPSEERAPFGAPDIIAAGGLEGVESIYAMHCSPRHQVGVIAVRSGALTAATDLVEIRFSGKGGHTARPHLAGDVVHALSRVVTEVPLMLSRRVDPCAAVTMVFGAVHAGEAANTIPMSGLARATVRVLSREPWLRLPGLVTELVHDVVAGTGVHVEVDYVTGTPPVINDRNATGIVAEAAATVVGRKGVEEADVSMGGEDFAFYTEQVPGAMIRLGVGVPNAAEQLDIHQSNFDVDERAIGLGVRVFVRTALEALAVDAF
jgi:amidohydrolase